jgi:hypothetical protein
VVVCHLVGFDSLAKRGAVAICASRDRELVAYLNGTYVFTLGAALPVETRCPLEDNLVDNLATVERVLRGRGGKRQNVSFNLAKPH